MSKEIGENRIQQVFNCISDKPRSKDDLRKLSGLTTAKVTASLKHLLKDGNILEFIDDDGTMRYVFNHGDRKQRMQKQPMLFTEIPKMSALEMAFFGKLDINQCSNNPEA